MCVEGQSCDHIGIVTGNIKALEDFYISKLGFKKEKEEMLDPETVRAVFGIDSAAVFVRLFSDGLKLELFQPLSGAAQGAPGVRRGVHHWGYRVHDRAAFARELQRHGVAVLGVSRNNGIVYFTEDPDGNKIELRE